MPRWRTNTDSTPSAASSSSVQTAIPFPGQGENNPLYRTRSADPSAESGSGGSNLDVVTGGESRSFGDAWGSLARWGGMSSRRQSQVDGMDISSAGGSGSGRLQIPKVEGRERDRPDPRAMMSGSVREGKQPARSFIHSSYRGPLPDTPPKPRSANNIRSQTAELAGRVLNQGGKSYVSDAPGFGDRQHHDGESEYGTGEDHEDTTQYGSDRSSRPETPISDASSGNSSLDGTRKPPSQRSELSRVLHASSPEDSDGPDAFADMRDEVLEEDQDGKTKLGRPRIRDAEYESGESSRLLPSTAAHRVGYGAVGGSDEESQYRQKNGSHSNDGKLRRRLTGVINNLKHKPAVMWSNFPDSSELTAKAAWEKGVVEPVKCLPAVVLGLLLNILDGLSYGLILFPLGEPIFSSLGPDGLSMFYVSCIISQLVYSCGFSAFPGGVGSEMIEVVPFFHKMAYTILAQVGKENEKAVLATTILSFALSSVLTGVVFFLLGACKLGSLIGFFPRHILVGCIGGVGWFLVATGLEVTAKLGSIKYNLDTLRKLIDPETLPLWIIPLALAAILVGIQTKWKHPMVVPGYFLAIPAVFYLVIVCHPALNVPMLRDKGWIFELPEAGVPFYHFYTLYDFRETNWRALASTVPAMFALTFFGILHVPINVPALAISMTMDDLNLDRELIAHGISNATSGLFGSIQNYLVYTNSLLFVRSGGNSRLAGIMLAFATAGVWVMGPTVIGYIPIMVVGALIFLLGIELLREALYDTWGKLQILEYLTICIIVVTMGAWDFVYGILVGILLACVSYVVQTSQKSAIRASYSGVIARSTVRRNPVQQRFLRHVGHQLHVIKLAGFLFFGTITGVEARVKQLLDETNFTSRPIRFLILDFWHVTGLDFSAAEGFTRMRRALKKRGVEMILSSVSSHSETGKALRSVGVWSDGAEDESVQVYGDLNAALEACENSFLQTFYRERDALKEEDTPSSSAIEMPDSHLKLPPSSSFHGASPRTRYLTQAVRRTLTEEPTPPPTKYANFAQPLPLILQTFQNLTPHNEDFWYRACRFFHRQEHPAGTILFRRGEQAKYFYILEAGVLRAGYVLGEEAGSRGRLDEVIVAGTTCGELPFFSETRRTAEVKVERRAVVWAMGKEDWERCQREEPEVAAELVRVAMKLSSERLGAITSYVLINA